MELNRIMGKNRELWQKQKIVEKNKEQWERWRIVEENRDLWDRWRILGKIRDLWDRKLWERWRIVREHMELWETYRIVKWNCTENRELWERTELQREQVIVGKMDNCSRYRELWETTGLWGETEFCDGQRIAGNSVDLWERLGIMGKIGNCGRHIQFITVFFSHVGQCSFSQPLSLHKGPLPHGHLAQGGSKMFPIPFRKKKLSSDLQTQNQSSFEQPSTLRLVLLLSVGFLPPLFFSLNGGCLGYNCFTENNQFPLSPCPYAPSLHLSASKFKKGGNDMCEHSNFQNKLRNAFLIAM